METRNLSNENNYGNASFDLASRRRTRALGSAVLTFGVFLLVMGLIWNDPPWLLLRVGLIMIAVIAIIPLGIKMLVSAVQTRGEKKSPIIYKLDDVRMLSTLSAEELRQELRKSFKPKHKRLLEIYANTFVAAKCGFLGSEWDEIKEFSFKK